MMAGGALARLRGKNDITFGVWCDIIRPAVFTLVTL
jgi:hypothetical protein